jgi:hypothetical protein
MKFFVLLMTLICVPVEAQVCQSCGRVHGPKAAIGLIAADGYPVICRTDERAYQHALREAHILASKGRVYNPLGCAPGTSASGCGSSFHANRPNHCYYRSGKRLVARARVMGRDGRFYFSAHYR